LPFSREGVLFSRIDAEHLDVVVVGNFFRQTERDICARKKRTARALFLCLLRYSSYFCRVADHDVHIGRRMCGVFGLCANMTSLHAVVNDGAGPN